MLYQQGDVLVESVETIPTAAKKLKSRNGRYVLADGEATGHAHAIVADKELGIYEQDGVLYMDLPKEVTITHEEHGPVTVPPGTYRVRGVQEYDHFLEESRKVAD